MVQGETSTKTCLQTAHQEGRGTADEVANVAELLMGDNGAFITGSDFLADGVQLHHTSTAS